MSSKRCVTFAGVLLVALVSMRSPGLATAGVWRDDFERVGLRDWVIYNFDKGAESWDAKQGEAIGRIELTDFYSLLILNPKNVETSAWSNYTATCRVRMLKARRQNAEPRMGISLYEQSDGEQRYLCLLALEQGEVQIVRATGDFWQAIPVAYPVEENVWYNLSATIRTEQNTESLTFRVNDDFEFTVTATDPLNSGSIGLVVSDGQAAFDDIEITGDSVPNGGPGKPRAVSPRGRLATVWATVKRR